MSSKQVFHEYFLFTRTVFCLYFRKMVKVKLNAQSQQLNITGSTALTQLK